MFDSQSSQSQRKRKDKERFRDRERDEREKVINSEREEANVNSQNDEIDDISVSYKSTFQLYINFNFEIIKSYLNVTQMYIKTRCVQIQITDIFLQLSRSFICRIIVERDFCLFEYSDMRWCAIKLWMMYKHSRMMYVNLEPIFINRCQIYIK